MRFLKHLLFVASLVVVVSTVTGLIAELALLLTGELNYGADKLRAGIVIIVIFGVLNYFSPSFHPVVLSKRNVLSEIPSALSMAVVMTVIALIIQMFVFSRPFELLHYVWVFFPVFFTELATNYDWVREEQFDESA